MLPALTLVLDAIFLLSLLMREKSSSNWAMWVMAIVAVPVLYILTLPPLMLGVMRSHGPGMSAPRWLRWYSAPADWVHEHTPLQDALETYVVWWMQFIPLRPLPTPPASSAPSPMPPPTRVP